jgi:hypothetical protein
VFGNPDDEIGGGGFNGGGFGGGYNPGGFNPGGQPGTNQPAAKADNPAFKDRLTEESLLNDWEFTIAIAIEIDPDAYQKPAPVDPDEQVSAAQ